MGGDDASVKVAVRVRPFNSREKGMGAKCCIKMNGPSTTITDPESGKPRTFAFDYSYWSHDGAKEDENGVFQADGPKSQYASQRTVYEDVGGGILKDAFAGYNSSLFAYGQTGAGKSYSMVGYGPNRGIIPIVCEELFKKAESPDKPENTEYQVTCSMLEIYNEQVRDLLNPKANKPGGLKVRSKPGVGVYVEGLTPVPVKDYDEIEKAMETGTKNRTVASTQMNATSSRAHTVFSILFSTISLNDAGEKTEMVSKLNLVDLAGSERADSTGATGDRLKEGSAINQSLSALGNVISALADQAMGKKKVFVPYRNSVLTRLLQDALGGNSKTIMIAALSPADVNFDETLSTLRYADRAKKIKNAVSKNENPTDKMIRELKEENGRLLKLLSESGIDAGAAKAAAAAGGGGGGGNSEAEAALKKQLEQQMQENQKLMEDMQRSWEEKLAEAQKLGGDDGTGAVSAQSAAASQLPSIVNLHEDPQLSECVVYVFKAGTTKIGRPNADEAQDIKIAGLNVKPRHAVVEHDEASGAVTLSPVDGSKTFVNGELVAAPRQLEAGDRVIFGNNFVFRFHHPGAEQPDGEATKWEAAMEEFATAQGLRLQASLDGSVSELEAEEAKRREELEAKLAEMEAQMAAERERARSALEAQRQAFEAGGGELSDEARAQLAGAAAAFEDKAADMERELAAKKEISTRLLESQQKRRRQNKKLQSELDALLPQVHEANSIAAELGRGVKFEAHLKVEAPKSVPLAEGDELRNLKQITAMVRVTDEVDGSEWNWPSAKFTDRLFLIRELYQEFLQYGPREVPRAEDPCWDPPEPVDIGRCFVYLKALSQLVEVESSFQVVDHRGEKCGQLSVEIVPETPQGDEMDYLQSADELLGKDVNLVVRVPKATGLPDRFANDVYVEWTFCGQTFETYMNDAKSTSPQWSEYAHTLCLEQIDTDIRDYLVNEAIIFEVKGFTDAQSRASGAHDQLAEYDAAQQAAAEAGAPAAPAGSAPPCEQCEEAAADVNCVDCSRDFCNACAELLHRSKRKAGHQRVPLAEQAYEPEPECGAAGGGLCEQCEEAGAVVQCVECERSFCDGCDALLHKSKRKAAHQRVALGGDGAVPGGEFGEVAGEPVAA